MTTPRERRFVFNEIAELYDRARPGYPDLLIDDVVSFSGITTGGRVLEIGAGTGKATSGFAARGFDMLCLEPGAELAKRARAHLARYSSVRLLPHTFESWPLEPRGFDLVVCGQAFHWLTPDIRFVKAAAALRAGGCLAVFGNAVVCKRAPIRDALDQAYLRHAPALARKPMASWHADSAEVLRTFRESGCFAEPQWTKYAWSVDYQTGSYLELLSTHSDHQILPEDQLESLLSAIGEAIDAHGGHIAIPYETHLYMARSLR